MTSPVRFLSVGSVLQMVIMGDLTETLVCRETGWHFGHRLIKDSQKLDVCGRLLVHTASENRATRAAACVGAVCRTAGLLRCPPAC